MAFERFVVALIVAGCHGGSQFDDCTVTCAATGGCPSGLACSTDGYCRAPGAAGTCAGIAPDAGGDRDGSVDPVDAAPGVDAGPQTRTLLQTANTTLAAINLATCWDDGDTDDTYEQSWYRVFALAEHGIVGRPFHVESVRVGIEESDGTPSIQIRIGTYSGTIGTATLQTAKLSVLASKSITVPETDTSIAISVPISATIPADGNLFVEVHAPDLIGETASVFIGTTKSAETRFGYILAPECGAFVPANVAAMDPTGHLMITATGWF